MWREPNGISGGGGERKNGAKKNREDVKTVKGVCVGKIVKALVHFIWLDSEEESTTLHCLVNLATVCKMFDFRENWKPESMQYRGIQHKMLLVV